MQRLFLCILPAFLFQCSFQTECNNFYNHAINEPFYLIFRIKKNRVLLLKHLVSMKLLLKMSKGLTWYKSTLISNYCITNKLNAPSSIIPHPDQRDSVKCFLYANGCFSTKSAWHALRTPTPQVFWAKCVWFPHSIPTWAIIEWMAILKRLPTKERLHAWGISPDIQCVFCDQGSKSHDHLFFTNDVSANV